VKTFINKRTIDGKQPLRRVEPMQVFPWWHHAVLSLERTSPRASWREWSNLAFERHHGIWSRFLE